MFNKKYGLTEAVLQGRKTMTRRLVKDANLLQWLHEMEVAEYAIKGTIVEEYSPYKVGEVVAIAQSYKDCGYDGDTKYGWCYDENEERTDVLYKDVPGWKNKMFVRSSRMPNRIRITDLKVERLQDISDEDCMKEGVFQWGDPFHEDRVEDFDFVGATRHYDTPREAFAALIDKVSGRGTWDSNPWVFAYSFELVK